MVEIGLKIINSERNNCSRMGTEKNCDKICSVISEMCGVISKINHLILSNLLGQSENIKVWYNNNLLFA